MNVDPGDAHSEIVVQNGLDGLGRAADGAEMTCRCPPQVVELERHCIIYLGLEHGGFRQ